MKPSSVVICSKERFIAEAKHVKCKRNVKGIPWRHFQDDLTLKHPRAYVVNGYISSRMVVEWCSLETGCVICISSKLGKQTLIEWVERTLKCERHSRDDLPLNHPSANVVCKLNL